VFNFFSEGENTIIYLIIKIENAHFHRFFMILFFILVFVVKMSSKEKHPQRNQGDNDTQNITFML
jgi:hypothetical protein